MVVQAAFGIQHGASGSIWNSALSSGRFRIFTCSSGRFWNSSWCFRHLNDKFSISMLSVHFPQAQTSDMAIIASHTHKHLAHTRRNTGGADTNQSSQLNNNMDTNPRNPKSTPTKIHTTQNQHNEKQHNQNQHITWDYLDAVCRPRGNFLSGI